MTPWQYKHVEGLSEALAIAAVIVVLSIMLSAESIIDWMVRIYA